MLSKSYDKLVLWYLMLVKWWPRNNSLPEATLFLSYPHINYNTTTYDCVIDINLIICAKKHGFIIFQIYYIIIAVFHSCFVNV